MNNLKIRDSFITFGLPQISEQAIHEVVETLNSGWIGPGPKVEQFELLFKEYIGAEHAIAVDSGTSALFLALKTIGIKSGDEVITSPMTHSGTANAIIHAGATPIFIDIHPDTMTIDVRKMEGVISPKTKAIIPVHLYGLPCHMDKIEQFSKTYKIPIIEDAAHCIEGKYKNRKIGNIGDLTCFSFHANKNMTTAKGGMITTNNREFAEILKCYRNNGYLSNVWERHLSNNVIKSEVVMPGLNFCMTDIQASIGLHQIGNLPKWHLKRKKIWEKYLDEFDNLPIICPKPVDPNEVHAYHLFTLQIMKEKCGIGRDQFRNRMNVLKVGTGLHYISLHMQKYYRRRYGFKRNDFPNASKLSETTVSLPLYPWLEDDDVDYIINAVRSMF